MQQILRFQDHNAGKATVRNIYSTTIIVYYISEFRCKIVYSAYDIIPEAKLVITVMHWNDDPRPKLLRKSCRLLAIYREEASCRDEERIKIPQPANIIRAASEIAKMGDPAIIASNYDDPVHSSELPACIIMEGINRIKGEGRSSPGDSHPVPETVICMIMSTENAISLLPHGGKPRDRSIAVWIYHS